MFPVKQIKSADYAFINYFPYSQLDGYFFRLVWLLWKIVLIDV